MINVLRADLIKLKRSFWFKFLLILWILSFTLIYAFLYFQIIKTPENYTWLFHRVIWNDNIFITINSFLYTFIVFWFWLLSDSIYWTDKSKNLILFTKNIRIKYFISKIIIILFFSFLIIFFISLLSSLSLFLIFKTFNKELFLILFYESFTKIFLLYVSIIPLLILFVFFNLIWTSWLIAWLLVIFVFFSNMLFSNYIEHSNIWKYYKKITEYTLLWNYNNILNSIISNNDTYLKININEKYLDIKTIEEYEKSTIDDEEVYKKIKPIHDLLNDWTVSSMYITSWSKDFLLELSKENPKIQSQIDNINKIFDWNPLLNSDDYLYDKYNTIYERLWWDNKYFDLNYKLNDEMSLKLNEKEQMLNSRYYLSLKSNFLSILKDFFNFNNRDFNVWLLHVIFLILTWSVIIKRREVFN